MVNEGGQNDAPMAEGGSPGEASDDSSERSRSSEGIAVATGGQGRPSRRRQGRMMRMLALDARAYVFILKRFAHPADASKCHSGDAAKNLVGLCPTVQVYWL